MRIHKIESGYLFDTIHFQASNGNRIVKIDAYGPVLAKIVSILRNLGWILSAGYACKEKLIQIPEGKKNHYLYPSDISSSICLCGETLPEGVTEINQGTIGLILNDLKDFEPKFSIAIPKSKFYDFNKRELLSKNNVKLLQEFKDKGINFHFASSIKMNICKEVLMDLPPGDYIILLAYVPRLIEIAKSDPCQKLLQSIPSPYVIAAACVWGAEVHPCPGVRVAEFQIRDENGAYSIKKECHILPLLYNNGDTPEKRTKLKEESNIENIELFKEKIIS